MWGLYDHAALVRTVEVGVERSQAEVAPDVLDQQRLVEPVSDLVGVVPPGLLGRLNRPGVVGASPSLTGTGWRERGGHPRQDYGAERCWVLLDKARALP